MLSYCGFGGSDGGTHGTNAYKINVADFPGTVTAGTDLTFTSYVVVGSLATVKTKMAWLSAHAY